MPARGFSITPARSTIAASIVLNIVLWVLVLTTFPKHETSVILHYTAGVGIDFIGSGGQIVILPSIGLIILLLNGILAWVVRRLSVATSWIFLSSIPMMQGLLIGTYLILLKLNS